MSKILRTCLIMLVFLSFGTLVYAQTVTGKVTSEKDGEPVIGASVSVKGTTRGVITDFDGNFSAVPVLLLIMNFVITLSK